VKICVLDDSYEQSGTVFKQFDFLPDPLRYLEGHDCERHFLHKATCVKEVMDLAKRGFDVFLNLCDGAWEEDRPGVEVIQALERLGVAFTGATSDFFEPTREAMKRICHYADIGTPAHVTAFDACGIERAADTLRFPLLVKHPNGYASIGITKASRVETAEDLRVQAAGTIDAFGATLIEEFIEGREFTVLVAENPDGTEPMVYQPVEFLFPPGETFKHFEMKWKDYAKMSCVSVDDAVLSAALKDMSGRFFTGLHGTGYGRCDIRMNDHGQLFMLEINPNCELFYPPGDEGSADFILLNDPAGHRGFVNTILKTALLRRAQRTRSWEVRKGRDGHYGMYAVCPLEAGGLIEQYEERPHVLVSKSHVERHWNATQQALFARYAWPITDEIYVMWSNDPLDWKPINHSCDPNAWLDGLNLTARRRVAPGEQITVDYCTFSNETLESFRCNCGAANCRGVVEGGDYRQPFVAAYGAHVSDYVRNKRRNGIG
jgi:D-alanine-D-alanine ligase-like ATP-grasp enzyme